MKARLSDGTIAYGSPRTIRPGVLERDAVFCYEGTFIDMDGQKVRVTADKLGRLAENHNRRYQLALAEATAAGKDEVDPAQCPPIQVDHSTSGWDTVGRVFGMLRLVQGYVPRAGAKPVTALVGPARFLGEDNCERASDGRWATLSTAADFESGEFTELTVTPFPAAKSAKLLKEGRLATYKGLSYRIVSKGRDPYTLWAGEVEGEVVTEWCDTATEAAKQARSFIDTEPKELAARKLSEGNMDKDRLKRHLTECKKMSAEDADKHLAALSDEDSKKLAAEADEEEKKRLAAEEDEKQKKLAAEKEEKDKKDAEDKKLAAERDAKVSRMSAAKGTVVRLAKELRSGFATSRLEGRKAGIATRLHKLRAEAKITPAELKKVDVVKLAAKPDSELQSFFEGFENREPVVLVGQKSSAKAEPVTKLAASHAKTTSKQQRLSSMPFTARAVGKKFGVEVDGDGNVKPVRLADPPQPKPHAEPDGDEMGRLNSHFAEACRMMDEGKREDAMRHLKDWMMSYRDGSQLAESPETAARMSALAEHNKKLENQFEELVKLVQPVFEIGDTELA